MSKRDKKTHLFRNVINNIIMKLQQIEKQIEKLENEIKTLSIKLNKTQDTETEKKLYKQKTILYHFEQIKSELIY